VAPLPGDQLNVTVVPLRVEPGVGLIIVAGVFMAALYAVYV
jgi:hypothetical protein